MPLHKNFNLPAHFTLVTPGVVTRAVPPLSFVPSSLNDLYYFKRNRCYGRSSQVLYTIAINMSNRYTATIQFAPSSCLQPSSCLHPNKYSQHTKYFYTIARPARKLESQKFINAMGSKDKIFSNFCASICN